VVQRRKLVALPNDDSRPLILDLGVQVLCLSLVRNGLSVTYLSDIRLQIQRNLVHHGDSCTLTLTNQKS